MPGALSGHAVGPEWKVALPIVVLDPVRLHLVGLCLVVRLDGRGGHGRSRPFLGGIDFLHN